MGSPPRQTEDPLSPPCVAFFDGNNGGATYKGVTAGEVRVLFYVDGGLTYSDSRGSETMPTNKYYNLFDAPNTTDPVVVRDLQSLQTFFNTRFQTYKRKVHFFVYFGTQSSCANVNPGTRKAEAADNLKVVQPFAVLPELYCGYQQDYIDATSGAGVMNFGGQSQRSAASFQKYPGLVWGFWPSLEQQAQQFSSLICTQVVNQPVSFGGNDSDPDARLHAGAPRRLGLVFANDPQQPQYGAFAALVQKQIEGCGGHFYAFGPIPHAGYSTGNRQSGTYEAQNMAAMKNNGVSTIIWAQGYENGQSKAAAGIGYRPEWILAGDFLNESDINGSLQEPSVWQGHAYVATTINRQGYAQDDPCYQAIKSSDPNAPDGDIGIVCSFVPMYVDIRQLFTAIQAAGPKLNPSQIDQGLHAIPAHPSGSPFVQACYYAPNDYTCVKDATVEWWDGTGKDVNGDQGCWRMIGDGLRYLSGGWPKTNISAKQTPNDYCNTFSQLAPVSQF